MYNPHDHYWCRDDGTIFSSSRNKTVAEKDNELKEWKRQGGLATMWPRNTEGHQTDDALQDVLTPQGIFMNSEAGLAAMKTAAKTEIDARAESERLKYITPGQGQALTYQRKSDEARRAIKDDDPTSDDYPLLAASIGIDGDTLKAVAETVIFQDNVWAKAGAAIERIRLVAKREVDAAVDCASVSTIVANLDWAQ